MCQHQNMHFKKVLTFTTKFAIELIFLTDSNSSHKICERSQIYTLSQKPYQTNKVLKFKGNI